MNEIISRAEAKAQNLKHYFTGKPCSRGHVALRFVSTFACIECAKGHYDEARKADPERYAAYAKKHYAENREKCIEAVKASAKKNPERVKRNKKSYRERNKAKIAKTLRNWYEANREDRLAYAKDYRVANRDKVLLKIKEWHSQNPEYGATWLAKNRDRARETARNRYHQKIRTNADYKAAILMRLTFAKVLRRAKMDKEGRATAEILGYTTAQFKAHLERHFLPDMNWSNHGTVWHVDHVVPVAEMLRLGVNDPKKIHALKNLLPVYAKDNLTKGAGFALSPQVLVA